MKSRRERAGRVGAAALAGCFLLSAFSASRAEEPAGPPAEAVAGLSQAEVAKMLGGEIVMESSAGGKAGSTISAALVFDLPLDRAWELLSHPENEDRCHDDCDEAIPISSPR